MVFDFLNLLISDIIRHVYRTRRPRPRRQSEHDHMKPKTLRKAANKTIRAKRRGRAFERAIARMAADPVMRAECAAITKDFRFAEADGLKYLL